jgi:hypothetical protein
VQALDHTTGWLAAAAVVTGLTRFVRTGRGVRSRLSLARTAVELERARSAEPPDARPHPPPAHPVATDRIETGWGPARLVRFPVDVDGAPARWARGPRPLGGDAPAWPS